MDYISAETMCTHIEHARAERARYISTVFANAFGLLLKAGAAAGRALGRIAAEARAFRHTPRAMKPADGNPA